MTSPATLPRFRPIHDEHAIVEEVIFFEFSPPLEQAMPSLIALKDELKNDLPTSDVLNVMKVQFTQHELNKPEVSAPEVQEAAGIRLSKFDESGILDTLISIEKNNISISCHKYAGWAQIWPKQREYIAKIFSKIVGSSSFLTGVGMRWTDQFIYEGDEAAYNAGILLNANSAHLHPSAFCSGSRWHCHTGWFDAGTSAGREVLNQLNLDAGHVNAGGSMRTAITVAHTQILRATRTLDDLADLVPGNRAGLDALSGLMESLHDGNKRILRDLLTEASRERIGLGAE